MGKLAPDPAGQKLAPSCHIHSQNQHCNLCNHSLVTCHSYCSQKDEPLDLKIPSAKSLDQLELDPKHQKDKKDKKD